jgi:hypothetical protein
MGYTIVGLKEKLFEFHPEFAQKGLNLKVTYDQESNRYELKLNKGGHEFTTYLEKKDADDCMDGKKCVNLAIQFTQFLAEFEDIVTPRKPG